VLDKFDFTRDEKGIIRWTPKPNTPQVVKKKTKGVYKDPHHFPVLVKIEDGFKSDATKMIKNNNLHIIQFLNKL